MVKEVRLAIVYTGFVLGYCMSYCLAVCRACRRSKTAFAMSHGQACRQMHCRKWFISLSGAKGFRYVHIYYFRLETGCNT